MQKSTSVETKLSRRSFLAATAGLAGAAAVAGIAGNALATDKKSDSAEGTVTVTDFKGREVTVPENIERVGVTCMGGGTQTVCAMGGADRLVVSPSM